MDCCIGIIILTIVTVGGILIYAQFATAAANRQRIAWTQTIKNLTLPELEKLGIIWKNKGILCKRSACFILATKKAI